jgi:integrase
MATIRLRYVNGYPNKDRPDGRVRYYFRRRGMAAIPLPGAPGSEEFMQAYGAALASMAGPEIGETRTMPGTVAALRANYYQSAAWLDLAQDTRQNRRFIIDRWCEQHRDKPVARLERANIEKMLANMPGSPATKDYWLRTIRGLLRSGIPSMIRTDPTDGIVVKRPKTEGHWTWEPEEIAQYRAHWPLGTMQRLVLEFALESASRRGEIVDLGPQHIRRGWNGEWRIKIARLKGSRDVDIPMTPELLAACQAMPKDHLRFIAAPKGGKIGKKTLGRWFAEWCDAAKLPKRCRLHGLKKSALCNIVLAGGTAPEMMAVSGHKDLRVVQVYIESIMGSQNLADAAIAKLRTKRVAEGA